MIEVLIALALVLGGALSAVALIGIYILFYPEKLEKIVGWIATFIAKVWRKADKTAVAMRVQGQINGLSRSLQADSPRIIDKSLKLKWTDAEEAEAVVRGGEVVVFMRDSRRHEENVANALMAFLPKALLSQARRYVEIDTMRAVDLTVAKALLAHDDSAEGALDVFYDRHLDPARANSDRLREKLKRLDAIDLHGWLARILLAEFQRVGGRLHPADPDPACLSEAEELSDWLYDLAALDPGQLGSLKFNRRYFKVAIIFVGLRDVLADHGIEPYRKRAKRHLYTDRFDSVYLAARDPNLPYVDELVQSLGGDAMVAESTRFTYRLRRDFAAVKRLNRTHAICVCLHRRQVGEEPDEVPSEEDAASGIPSVDYAPAVEEPDAALDPGDRGEPEVRAPVARQ